MQPLRFCLFSHYFSTNTAAAATSAETKYAFILYAVEMWENRPQIASCLWLERGKKRFHSTRAKMPVYFYSRNSMATFILQNKFFLHTFSRQRNAFKSQYATVSEHYVNGMQCHSFRWFWLSVIYHCQYLLIKINKLSASLNYTEIQKMYWLMRKKRL